MHQRSLLRTSTHLPPGWVYDSVGRLHKRGTSRITRRIASRTASSKITRRLSAANEILFSAAAKLLALSSSSSLLSLGDPRGSTDTSTCRSRLSCLFVCLSSVCHIAISQKPSKTGPKLTGIVDQLRGIRG